MINPESPEGFTSPKIIPLDEAAELIRSAKAQGKKVGLCHGGFDLLHPGHIKHFESAKKLCDVLIVSVTSDRFVAGRKGSGRPVFSDQLRAYSIAALDRVDHVVITDVEKAVPILELLQPSYYIKGPDFIHKTTPGITAEREAIAKYGGEMKYTADPKLSTTEIIHYIKEQLDRKEILVVLDRDGTLIEHVDFLGTHDNWREETRLCEPVVSFLSYLQTKYKTTNIIISNQAGVARGNFTCERVEEIHHHLNQQLNEKGITIHSWKYCPDVDSAYAELKKGELTFLPQYVKPGTQRKPDASLFHEALGELNRTKDEFAHVLALGDRHEDEGLANNLGARYINVEHKTYEELRKEFSGLFPL